MIRVLHVVENFNGQAVETWLTRVVSSEAFDPTQIHFDFFLLGVGPGRRADLVLNLGCKLVEGNCGGTSIPKMAETLRRAVSNGAYDFVHIHQDVLGGIFALALFGIDAKIIIQAHNCHQRLPVGGYWKERILTNVARLLVLHLADHVVGVSTVALAKLVGKSKRVGRHDHVIYCGVDSKRFLLGTGDRNSFRSDLGLPNDSLILLFIGRLVPEKNPAFVLPVLQELRKQEPRAVAVFVGAGSEELLIKELASRLGLSEATRFLGWRSDVAEIMFCCDWFIHTGPEVPMEGFGLVALEAQLAGLRLLLSHGIPDDVLLPGSCYQRISVSEPIADWAREARLLLRRQPPASVDAALALSQTRMDQGRAIDDLIAIYGRLTFC